MEFDLNTRTEFSRCSLHLHAALPDTSAAYSTPNNTGSYNPVISSLYKALGNETSYVHELRTVCLCTILCTLITNQKSEINLRNQYLYILAALVVIVHAQLKHPDLLKKFGGMFQKPRPHPQHDFRHYVALFYSTDLDNHEQMVYV